MGKQTLFQTKDPFQGEQTDGNKSLQFSTYENVRIILAAFLIICHVRKKNHQFSILRIGVRSFRLRNFSSER